MSWNSLAAEMDKRWPVGSSWTQPRLHHMIGSDVYLGFARSGEFSNPKAHAPIVTRVEWEAAQGNGKPREWRGIPRLLSGIARCATCGYSLRKDYTRPHFAKYACGGRKAKAVCASPVTIGAERLDNYLSDLFLERLRAEPVVIGGTSAPDDLVEAVRRLEDAEAEVQTFMSTTLVTDVGVELFEAQTRQRVDAVGAARTQVAELQRLQPSVTLTAAVLDEWPTLRSRSDTRSCLRLSMLFSCHPLPVVALVGRSGSVSTSAGSETISRISLGWQPDHRRSGRFARITWRNSSVTACWKSDSSRAIMSAPRQS